MQKARCFVFEPFRLDVIDERLWHGDQSIRLGHKALTVLHRLVSQPGQLVTKEDLLSAAWPDTAVSEAVLTTAIRELRRALGDEARIPRFVQTVHRRGYRFIAPVADTSPVPRSRVDAARCLIGRDAEWAALHDWLAAMQQGRRLIGFIAGEAGIGKTALVDAFVSEIEATGAVRVGRGQCIEHYGEGEAYLPILEAFGRLGRDADSSIVGVLRDHAPSWLPHLPSLAPREGVQAPAHVTPARMLRELADAVEIITAQTPLILVFEDLHWSDAATLEWLAYVARRRDAARLLVLGTYRSVEAVVHRHPVRKLISELRGQQSVELVLDHLQRESVEAYVRQRCGSMPAVKDLAEVLHRRTGGHPLFLSTIVDELVHQRNAPSSDASNLSAATVDAIARVTPASVRQFIEYRFEQLSDEDQTIIEAASVAGDPFYVADLAAATSRPPEVIDARCAAWTREGRFLIADDRMSWPEGTRAGYRFRHGLFQEVAYARVAPERRARLHQQIGKCLERAYGHGAAMAAAELAVHFEQGRDGRKAVSYLEQAARNALLRSAYVEAHRHLSHALDVLQGLPERRERFRREVTLLLLLGHVLHTTKGWSVEEVERVYSRARVLCEDLGDESHLLHATWGVIVVSLVRAELRKAEGLTKELLGLAKKRRDTTFRMVAHMELGGTALLLAKSASSRNHFREAEALYDRNDHGSYVADFGADMGLFAQVWASHLLWHDGYAERARAKADETVRLAGELAHPFTRVITLAYAGMLNQFRRDIEAVERLAEATITHSAEHGFPYYLAWAQVLRGWCRARRSADAKGIGELRHGLDVLERTAGLRVPYYRALLAEACGEVGRIDEGLQALADAFVTLRKTGERWWEAELHRLRGELLRLVAADRSGEAETCFRTALDLARRQHAKSLELRAAVSLGRLWQDQGKRADARRLLTSVYGWFTEGFDTPDLADARSLLKYPVADTRGST